MKRFASAFALPALLAWNAMAGLVTDSGLGYSINLPANWVQVKTRDVQHNFKDATAQYPSRISILRYAIDKADYPTPESWTQAQFIAYMLAVETSVFPYGTVAYYDSSASAKLGQDWAPEAFSMLFPADGSGTYCEFIRFCAHDGFGYEIYAIGDSTDMMNRVDFYAGIISTITFSAPTAALAPPRPAAVPATSPLLFFDARGRLVRSDAASRPAFRPVFPMPAARRPDP